MKNESIRKVINVDKPNYVPLFEFKELDNAVIRLSLFKDSVEFDITGQTVKLGAKTSKGLKEQSEGFTINKNNLDIDLKNSILVPGAVEIDLELKDVSGAMTTASFFITVKSKVLNNKAVESTNEFDTFTKTVAKVEEDYKGLRRIIIDENQAANLQDQVNQTNAHLEHMESEKASKQEVDVERKRIDNFTKLTEGSTTGDAELIDGRIGADGVIYENIGGAIRGQVGLLGGIIDNSIDATIFENAEINTNKELGYYFNSNNVATFVSSPNFNASVINVKSFETYYISAYLLGVGKLPTFMLCDNNLNVLKQGQVITTDTQITDLKIRIPNGVTKLVVSSHSLNGRKLVVKKATSLIGVNTLDINTINKNINDYLIPNIFTNSKITKEQQIGYYYNSNNIATFASSPNFKCLVLDVIQSETYYLSMYLVGVGRLPTYMLCDNSLNVLKQGEIVITDTQITDLKVTIPTGVTKLVVSSNAINGHELVVKKSVSSGYLALEKIEEIKEDISQIALKPLSSYKYIAFGDSITEISSRWRDEFKRITGAKEIKCYAVSGAHLCDYADTVLDGNPTGSVTSSNTVCNQVKKMLLNPPTEIPDFIMISAMTNDFLEKSVLDSRALPNFQNNVGEYRSGKPFIPIDSVNRTQVDGAMRWIAEKIWSVYPNTKIIFVAPIQSADSNTRPTWSILAKGELMKYVASNLGCKTIMAGAECGIYANREVNGANGKYLEDGLHPNIEGGKVLGAYNARQVINFLKG